MSKPMKPIVNLNELDDYQSDENGKYAESYSPVSDKIGAKNLSYSVTIVPPGKRVCPMHNHHVSEEMFMILEGQGTLRFGDKEYPIKALDVIACPPGGQEVAHQIINTSDKELKYFCLSDTPTADIVEYPDSNKTLSLVRKSENNKGFRHISSLAESVDYYHDEQ